MADAAVTRLKLRARPGRAALATHRVTEALRLAPVGPERLLLVRRLALGRLSTAARPSAWEARATAALAERSAQAVHGGVAMADVEAVWFRSANEARALLFVLLASGRRPTAWFWRLAVPEWAELSLEAWLPRWVALASPGSAEEAALARAVVAVAEAGYLPRLMAALRTVSLARDPYLVRPAPPSPPSPRVTEVLRHASGQDRLQSATDRAQAVLARLPATARAAVLEILARPSPHAKAEAWLARMVVLAATPEAASAETFLAEITSALVLEALRLAHAAEETIRPTRYREPPRDPDAARASKPREQVPMPDLPDVLRPLPDNPNPEVEAEDEAPITRPRVVVDVESRSRLAGLFLLVRPLERMGFDVWLEARPEEAASGFARALLRAIARRMGAADDDPVLAALMGNDDPAWTGDLTAWRVGLDRWLRRRARIRLADVARRPGGLLLADDLLEVRFAPDAADVRLRRLALDLDPNWVPWLGLSVRYHYRDEPLA